MSDPESERERIREQKREELVAEHGDGSGVDNPDTETPTAPIEIEGPDHLDSVVAEYDVVLVDCYADWCGPCQMMEPAIEGVAANSGAVVAKVDVDRHQQLAEQLGVQSIPTLLLSVDGEFTNRLTGTQDRGTLDRLVEQAGESLAS